MKHLGFKCVNRFDEHIVLKKRKDFLLLLGPLLLMIFWVSCLKPPKKDFDLNLTPEEKFLMNITDIGNLIGQHEMLLFNALGRGEVFKSDKKEIAGLNTAGVKVVKYTVKGETMHFWFVDHVLAEIHIPVSNKLIFDEFSRRSTREGILGILGKPSVEYSSKTEPKVTVLTYRSNRFALHFVLSNFNLKKGAIFDPKIMESDKRIDVRLREIRLTSPNERALFISYLENRVFEFEKELMSDE